MAIDLDKLPSAKIVPLIKDHLLTLSDVTDVFDNKVYTYRRHDNVTQFLPALNIYLESEKLRGQMSWLDGVIVLEAIVEPKVSREDLSSKVSYINNMLFLHLNSNDLINMVRETLPWVTSIATELKWDMRNSLGLTETEDKDAYLIKGTINYTINLLEYYYSVQEGDDLYEDASVVITPQS